MHNGIALILAWPQTFCKQPGSWYDPLMHGLGISKNNYYQVGHAAIVLIDQLTGACHYFDFGRYHSPFGFGRVRGIKHDPELEMHTRAQFDKNSFLINYVEILEELAIREACHGDGNLHASQIRINFASAFNKAIQMQNQSPIPYGPFITDGTNCSRFVRSVAVAGNPSFREKFRLLFKWTFSPTPLGNVRVGSNYQVIMSNNSFKVQTPLKKSKSELQQVLRAPVRNAKIPAQAIWLAGEGAGSWFVIEEKEELLIVERLSSRGEKECTGIVTFDKNNFDPSSPYELSYPSHCENITIFQKGRKIQFEVNQYAEKEIVEIYA